MRLTLGDGTVDRKGLECLRGIGGEPGHGRFGRSPGCASQYSKTGDEPEQPSSEHTQHEEEPRQPGNAHGGHS